MKKYYTAYTPIYLQWILCFMAVFLPEWAFAQSTAPIDFAPPPSDLSVVFLTDIFGTVDGVLYGGGSQIMGAMFSVFNSAVLALGGMVVMYSMMVGTINTAGDGQVMGKNWSSIWIPIRTTLGISLLFTYSSGYSVLQVFVMWIVVQGVGAGDLIWDAALGYLQRGGVIVQPTNSAGASSGSANYDIINGASNFMAGTTCMLALQNQLQTLRSAYTTGTSTVCTNVTTTAPQSYMSLLCNNSVPDFLSSVEIMTLQTAAQDALNTCYTNNPTNASTYCTTTTVKAPMPNFPAASAYASLNGICGTVSWNLMSPSQVSSASSDLSLSASEEAQLSNSRGLAVAQMYSDLSLVAQSIVTNDYTLLGTDSAMCGAASATCYYYQQGIYSIASPLGVAATTSGVYNPACSNQANQSNSCNSWVAPASSSATITTWAPVLNGTEFQGATSDYNSIMLPALNALYNTSTIAANTGFITNAETQGWIMAGSYFYNLAALNANDSNSSQTDTNSGLGSGQGSTPLVYQALTNNGSTNGFCNSGPNSSTYSPAPLCIWYDNGNASNSNTIMQYNQQIEAIIAGNASMGQGGPLTTPQFASSGFPPQTNGITLGLQLNATAYGYMDNASNVVIPGQPGLAPPSFSMQWSIPANHPTQTIPTPCHPSGFMSIPKDVCQATIGVVIDILDLFIQAVVTLYQVVVIDAIIGIPLAAFAQTFNSAAAYMGQTTTSPIISLAQMGNLFINECLYVWTTIAFTTALATVVPEVFGPVLITLLVLGPFILAMLGVLWTMGIATAYYIPLLPYIIFTFAAFGWMIGVIEAMVAAPIVALGVTLPEGKHDVFGNGQDAIMLLFNAFLRPSMMIIGYIAAIIVSTVGIWFLNTGFGYVESGFLANTGETLFTPIFSNFFLFTTYVTMCIEIVDQSFQLIYKLPDRVLRWIGGGMQDSFGSESAGQASGKVAAQTEKGGGAVQSGAQSQFQGPKKDGGDSPKGGGGGGASGSGSGGGAQLQSGPSSTPSGGGASISSAGGGKGTVTAVNGKPVGGGGGGGGGSSGGAESTPPPASGMEETGERSL